MSLLKTFLEEEKRKKSFPYFKGEVVKELREGFSGVSSRYPASVRDISPFSKILSLTLCWEILKWEETKEYLLVEGKKNKAYFIRK